MTTRRVTKRVSKLQCKRTTRKNSKMPPFNATTCPEKIKRGKDGLYTSTEDKNGVYRWKKIRA